MTDVGSPRVSNGGGRGRKIRVRVRKRRIGSGRGRGVVGVERVGMGLRFLLGVGNRVEKS